ncbi:hypothetical protein P8452_36774 [Trifolium repens]|jgi:hypothetical protein|nr:hypothetical protein P8452_36774 [Trifolium repens]
MQQPPLEIENHHQMGGIVADGYNPQRFTTKGHTPHHAIKGYILRVKDMRRQALERSIRRATTMCDSLGDEIEHVVVVEM